MWADSNAAVLSFSNAIFGYLSLLLFVFILFLILIQYLRNRKNKPMSKIIAVGGFIISLFILLMNLFMTFANIEFLQEQIEIVNNPDYRAGFAFIREGWIEDGYNIITWNIIYSIALGLLPLWLFYRQYRRIFIN